MTEAEKIKKILSATKDSLTLKSLLDKGNFRKAEKTVNSITSNTDYTEEIIKSRIKHNIPYGNMSFSMLSFIHQRNALIMLLEAVEATLTKLSLPHNKEENND